MERYTVIKKIGTGVLSSVFTVTDKKDHTNKVFVLKELECLDHTSAKSVLEEFRLYHSFGNHSVCKIHDCFIKWESKISSVFVCYVMDYFEEGLLSNHLEEQRSLQKIIPLDILQNILGSLINGLYYFHKNGIIHRNLKPSSLYMRTVKGAIRIEIGDFGPSVIMKDIKSSARIKPSVFNYQAPEIIDAQEFEINSDVWSIGTTLLDMCTTGIFDLKEFQMHLLNIRHDGDLLEQILRDVHKVYNCTGLLKILKFFLCRSSQDRLNLKSVIHLDFVQQCLQSVDSDLVDKFIESSNEHVILPKDRTIKSTVAFSKNIRNEKTMMAAMERLIGLMENQDFDLNIEENQCFLQDLMSHFPNNIKILNSGLKVFEEALDLILNEKISILNSQKAELSDSSTDRREFIFNLNSKFLEKFFYLFLEYDNRKDMLTKFVPILIKLSHFNRVVDQLAGFKISNYTLGLIEKNIKDTDLVFLLCKLIWCLSSNDQIMKSFAGLKSLTVIRNVLIDYQKDPLVTQMAVNAAVGLMLNSKLVIQEEIGTDLTSALLIALENHLDVPKIVRSCCMAFSALINLLEESAFRFVYLPTSDMNNEISGFELLKEAYCRHKDKSQIVLQICNVFRELIKYDQMVVEIKSVGLHQSLIVEISQRFRDNIEITEKCATIILAVEERIKYEQALENQIAAAKNVNVMWKKLFNNPANF